MSAIYQTRFGSLKHFDKGHVEIIDDDGKMAVAVAEVVGFVAIEIHSEFKLEWRRWMR